MPAFQLRLRLTSITRVFVPADGEAPSRGPNPDAADRRDEGAVGLLGDVEERLAARERHIAPFGRLID